MAESPNPGSHCLTLVLIAGTQAQSICCLASNRLFKGWSGRSNFNFIPFLCIFAGAFLIPYVVFFICCGIPVFFLETALGQFTSEGGITCWRKVCPLFEGTCWVNQNMKECLGIVRLWRAAFFNKLERDSDHCLFFVLSGIGYATQVIEAHLNVYYIIILAWAIFYLSNCFTTELPWATCGHEWNTGMASLEALSAGLTGRAGIDGVSHVLLWVQVPLKLGVISVPGLHTRMSWALAQGLVQGEELWLSYLALPNIEAVSFGHTVRMQVWSAKLRSRASGCDSSPASECQIFLSKMKGLD